jgi:hypothetical protein
LASRLPSGVIVASDEKRFDSYERTQFNDAPEKIKLSTELSTEQVMVHSAVERLTVDFAADWYVDLGVTELVFEIEKRMISHDRKSRAEAADVYKGAIPEQPKEGGVINTLMGRH